MLKFSRNLALRLKLEYYARTLCLQDKLFQDKRILLIGPAAGAIDECKDIIFEEYDVIARINRGLNHAINSEGALGNRTDLIFHNFNFEGNRAAGNLHISSLREHNVSKIIFMTPSSFTIGRFLSKRQQLLTKINNFSDIEMLPPDQYRNLVKSFHPFFPTAGSIVIDYLLRTDFQKLSVVGFSLFKSGYEDNYNPIGNNIDETREWVKASGVHNPDLDYIYTRDRLMEVYRGPRNLYLGQGLLTAIGV
jgi:hypothetical protein